MNLNFSEQELAFRDQVRSFLEQKLPHRLRDKTRGGIRLLKSDMDEWQALLAAQGWLAPEWPAQYGGVEWDPVQRFIFDNECALANTPWLAPFGVNMLGPVLIKYGSEEQRAHYLPRILDGSDFWCQGYSEPGAGSDLASLKTQALRDGDAYVVNGQKTWTTLGHFANKMFCLVRTSNEGKRQQGISFLLVDMDTPGIEVRPIITIDGNHEVNEVFFTDVRVPVANRVGKENEGWTYAKFLLTHERTGIAGVGLAAAAMQWLKDVAARQFKAGRPLAEDPLFAARMARVEIDLENMKTTNLRVLDAVAGGGAPSAESSMLKIKGTEIRQELSSLIRRAMGPYAQPFVPEALEEGYNQPPIGPADAMPVASQYFVNRKISIYGGSNEIQKNIIAKTILEL